MKIEQLIVQHLYNNKKVTLQDIGSFILSSGVTMPAESDKDGIMPDNAVIFEYNTRATVDESLIDFIVQQTRKIKPLATSDLESYCILGREYLNIGKPFPIEGLGTLQKSQTGQYEFIQGHSINPKLQAAPALLKEKDNEEIVFATPPRKASGNNAGMIIGILLFLGLVTAAIVYFVNRKDDVVPVESNVLAEDSAALAGKDTLVNLVPAADTTLRSSSDSSVFKVVIKEYPTKAAADAAMNKLTSYGHKLVVYSQDSVSYKVAMPFYTNVVDSAKARDSLRAFFGGKPYIDTTRL